MPRMSSLHERTFIIPSFCSSLFSLLPSLFLLKFCSLFLSFSSLLPHSIALSFDSLYFPFFPSFLIFLPLKAWKSLKLVIQTCQLSMKFHSTKFIVFFVFLLLSNKFKFACTLRRSFSVNDCYFCLAVSPLAALLFHYVEFIHDQFRTKTLRTASAATCKSVYLKVPFNTAIRAAECCEGVVFWWCQSVLCQDFHLPLLLASNGSFKCVRDRPR